MANEMTTAPLSGWIIAFDLDGTLVDTAPDIINAVNHVLVGEGVEPLELTSARHLIGRGARELMRRAYEQSGLRADHERFDELLQKMLDYYQAHILIDSQPYPGMREALTRLKAAGARLCVCTNKHTYLARELIDAMGIAPDFGSIRGADSVTAKKPDAGHLKACVDDMSGDLTRTIMVGDSETDYLTAVNAGVPSIIFTFGYSEVPVQGLKCDHLLDHYDVLFDAVETCIKS